jgi:pimeloyl-ACP methyl ester carboxylesterase
MPASSKLARLQRWAPIGILAAALLSGALLWSWSPIAAVVVALLVALAHGIVLALEFLLLRLASRGDPTPTPSVSQLVSAWAREVVQDAVVFGWRQPFDWQRVPDHLQGAAGVAGIVFIHGFVCNRGFWTPWMREARNRGHAFVAVNLEPVFCSIDDYCQIIDEAVRAVSRATGRPPMLVCHSMGGLAARAWLRQDGGRTPVAHVVTVGTPHGGTWLARFSRLPSGRQMRVGCDWLAALPGAEPDAARLFTCWYSNCDNVVFPPSTATLPAADNRLLEGAAHVDLAFRPTVVEHTFALAARL